MPSALSPSETSERSGEVCCASSVGEPARMPSQPQEQRKKHIHFECSSNAARAKSIQLAFSFSCSLHFPRLTLPPSIKVALFFFVVRIAVESAQCLFSQHSRSKSDSFLVHDVSFRRARFANQSFLRQQSELTSSKAFGLAGPRHDGPHSRQGTARGEAAVR